ncbi:ABC transporter permease [Ruminococcus sp. NK3A76]|uniref:ABC transporter permease n=1 Tax=Ruminococcus sp. NK3A76 TaxID=877411 RepID=UPI00048DA217|nr:ABC transporter permease [Ruminococcus sp. NK3A76]
MQVSLQRMKANIKAEKLVCIRIYEIFIVACLLIVLICSFASEGLMYDHDYVFGVPTVYPIVYIAVGVISLLFSVKIFRDMHNPTQSDIMLSLPMTAKERYFSKVLVFFRCIVLPFIICGVVSTVCTMLSDYFIFEHHDSFIVYVRGSLIFFMIGLSVIMLTGAMSFLCSVMSNSFAEAAITSVFAVGSAALLPLLMLELIFRSAQISENARDTFIAYPLYYCFGLDSIQLLDLEMMRTEGIYKAGFTPMMIGLCVNILMSFGIMMIGYPIYRRRDRATLTCNRFAKPFLMCIIGLTGIAAIIYASIGAMAYIPYAAVVAGGLVYGFLLKRNGFEPKKCGRWFAGLAGIMCGFVALSAVVYFTDGLGYPTHPSYMVKNGGYSLDICQHFEDKETEDEVPGIYMECVYRDDIDEINKTVSEYDADVKTVKSFSEFIGLTGHDLNDYTGHVRDPLYKPEGCRLLAVSMYPFCGDGISDVDLQEYDNCSYYIRIHDEDIPKLRSALKERFGDRMVEYAVAEEDPDVYDEYDEALEDDIPGEGNDEQ